MQRRRFDGGSDVGAERRAAVRQIAIVGVLIIVIAAINFVTLMTARAVRRAIEEPLRQIAENAGLEGSVVVNDVRRAEPDEIGLCAALYERVALEIFTWIDPSLVAAQTIMHQAHSEPINSSQARVCSR